MAPRSKLPNCRECGEQAYEELQPSDGAVHIVATHKIECKSCPFVPFAPDKRAASVVVRYDRALAKECKVTL